MDPQTQNRIDQLLVRELHGSKSATRDLDKIAMGLDLAGRIALDLRAEQLASKFDDDRNRQKTPPPEDN